MKHDYADIRQYMGRDLAKTHHTLAEPLSDEERAAIAGDLRAIEEHRFVIYERVLDREQVDAVNAALSPLYGAPGRTGIEGFATRAHLLGARQDARVRSPRRSSAHRFFAGTPWHGGGANRSTAVRRAVSAQYCQPWLRTQENLALGTPRAIVRELSPDLQSCSATACTRRSWAW